jgi:hypothetical protein
MPEACACMGEADTMLSETNRRELNPRKNLINRSSVG